MKKVVHNKELRGCRIFLHKLQKRGTRGEKSHKNSDENAVRSRPVEKLKRYISSRVRSGSLSQRRIDITCRFTRLQRRKKYTICLLSDVVGLQSTCVTFRFADEAIRYYSEGELHFILYSRV
jgi:hypothetical protein